MRLPKEFQGQFGCDYWNLSRPEHYFCSWCDAQSKHPENVNHRKDCKLLKALLDLPKKCKDGEHKMTVCPCKNEYHGHNSWTGPKGDIPVWYKHYCKICKRLNYGNSNYWHPLLFPNEVVKQK